MESGSCTHGSYWGVTDRADEDEIPTAAELRAMTVDQVFAVGGAAPAIDGWVVPKHPLEIMDEGGCNVDSVIMGGNSFDGLLPFMPETAQPNNPE